jgi:hypothetical protein
VNAYGTVWDVVEAMGCVGLSPTNVRLFANYQRLYYTRPLESIAEDSEWTYMPYLPAPSVRLMDFVQGVQICTTDGQRDLVPLQSLLGEASAAVHQPLQRFIINFKASVGTVAVGPAYGLMCDSIDVGVNITVRNRIGAVVPVDGGHVVDPHGWIRVNLGSPVAAPNTLYLFINSRATDPIFNYLPWAVDPLVVPALLACIQGLPRDVLQICAAYMAGPLDDETAMPCFSRAVNGVVGPLHDISGLMLTVHIL